MQTVPLKKRDIGHLFRVHRVAQNNSASVILDDVIFARCSSEIAKCLVYW